MAELTDQSKTISDRNTTIGKNWLKVAKFAEGNPEPAFGKLVKFYNAHARAANIRKIKEAGFKYAKGTESAKDGEIGSCGICEHQHLERGSHIEFICNGKTISPPGLVGGDCEKKIVQVFSGLNDKKFRVEYTPSEKKANESLEQLTIELAQLPRKYTSALREQGYQLDEKIAVQSVKDLQKAIMKDDLDGIRLILDPGKTKEMIKWAIADQNALKAGSMADPILYDIVKRLEHPKALAHIRPSEWLILTSYVWQNRELSAEGEIGDLRKEIKYMLGQNAKINLDAKVRPVRLYKKAEWAPATIGDLLSEDRTAITKAQRFALEKATKIDERRRQYNQEALNRYFTDESLKPLIRAYARFTRERRKSHAKGIQEPSAGWNDSTTKKLRKVFKDAHKKIKQNNITAKEYFLSFINAHEAQEVARTIYVESRKIELSKTEGLHVLKTSYTAIVDAEEILKTENLDSKLKKIAYGAFEFDNAPKNVKEKYRTAGITQQKLKNLVEEIAASAEHGIIPTKTLEDGSLEKALRLVENYQQDALTARNIAYLAKLEKGFPELKFDKIQAETGKTTYGKATMIFSTKPYIGKKFFSPTQSTIIGNAVDSLPNEVKNANMAKARRNLKKAAEFYQNHKIYDSRAVFDDIRPVLDVTELKVPERTSDRGYSYQPIGWAQAEMHLSKHYKPASPELAEKIQWMISQHNSNAHLGDLLKPEALITQELAQNTEKAYEFLQKYATNMSQRI